MPWIQYLFSRAIQEVLSTGGHLPTITLCDASNYSIWLHFAESSLHISQLLSWSKNPVLIKLEGSSLWTQMPANGLYLGQLNPYPAFLRSISILFPHLYLGLPSCIFPWHFVIKISPVCVTCCTTVHIENKLYKQYTLTQCSPLISS
jgi:hypothetical protein